MVRIKENIPLNLRYLLLKLYKVLYKKHYYTYIQWKYKKKIRTIRCKAKIKVAFFLIHESVWKYEYLYNLFSKDIRFEPVIVICPYTVYGEEEMLKDMIKAYKYCLEQGYRVIKSYNEELKEWIDIKNIFSPDIIFFTNPHKLTKDEYYITNNLNSLTCYAPYGVTHTHLNEMQYDLPFHNLLWKYFVETELHRKMAFEYSTCKGNNTVVTGYPGIDPLFFNKTPIDDPWKNKDRKLKRIIWAPHHTIDEDKAFLSYSNFINLSDVFLNIATANHDKVQIAFKPHPLLKKKLYGEKSWGKERTDIYYSKWENLPNGQLNESDYINLFQTSDAMILDSGSFLNEYLCVNKPSLYLVRDENLTCRYNEFGKMAFAQHYHGKDEHDILNFINDIVIAGKDNLKNSRENFVEKYLLPPNNVSASQNIYEYLLKQIFEK